MKKIGRHWYNGHGQRIYRPCAYARAVAADRYGYNGGPCRAVPDRLVRSCRINFCDWRSRGQGGWKRRG